MDKPNRRQNTRHLYADLTSLRIQVKELTKERDLALAHDTQSYPTASAYEQVCKTLESAQATTAEKDKRSLTTIADLTLSELRLESSRKLVVELERLQTEGDAICQDWGIKLDKLESQLCAAKEAGEAAFEYIDRVDPVGGEFIPHLIQHRQALTHVGPCKHEAEVATKQETIDAFNRHLAKEEAANESLRTALGAAQACVDLWNEESLLGNHGSSYPDYEKAAQREKQLKLTLMDTLANLRTKEGG